MKSERENLKKVIFFLCLITVVVAISVIVAVLFVLALLSGVERVARATPTAGGAVAGTGAHVILKKINSI